jgi:hypothetical protein
LSEAALMTTPAELACVVFAGLVVWVLYNAPDLIAVVFLAAVFLAPVGIRYLRGLR